jgi:hypothetical protein
MIKESVLNSIWKMVLPVEEETLSTILSATTPELGSRSNLLLTSTKISTSLLLTAMISTLTIPSLTSKTGYGEREITPLQPFLIDPAMERVTVELDSFSQTLPVGSCSQKPNGLWLCKGNAPGVVTVRITPKGDFTIVAQNVPIPDPGPSAPLLPNLRFRLFIGNDAGEMEIYYTGGTRTAS